MIAELLLILTGIYLFCGVVFAVPFAFFGVGKIDPHAARGTWGFRFLIIPGTAFLWPLLARRWFTGVSAPPEERNPHRRSVGCGRPTAESASSIGGSTPQSALRTPHSV